MGGKQMQKYLQITQTCQFNNSFISVNLKMSGIMVCIA